MYENFDDAENVVEDLRDRFHPLFPDPNSPRGLGGVEAGVNCALCVTRTELLSLLS